MGFGWPNKAKGIPYNTSNVSASVSGDYIHPLDSWIDFKNKQIVLVYGDNNEGNVRVSESVITYNQDKYPINPEYGEIWIKENGISRIYRLPPIGWDFLTAASGAPTTPIVPEDVYESWIKVSGQNWITTTNYFDSMWASAATGDYLIPADSNNNTNTYWSTDTEGTSAVIYPTAL